MRNIFASILENTSSYFWKISTFHTGRNLIIIHKWHKCEKWGFVLWYFWIMSSKKYYNYKKLYFGVKYWVQSDKYNYTDIESFVFQSIEPLSKPIEDTQKHKISPRTFSRSYLIFLVPPPYILAGSCSL